MLPRSFLGGLSSVPFARPVFAFTCRPYQAPPPRIFFLETFRVQTCPIRSLPLLFLLFLDLRFYGSFGAALSSLCLALLLYCASHHAQCALQTLPLPLYLAAARCQFFSHPFLDLLGSAPPVTLASSVFLQRSWCCLPSPLTGRRGFSSSSTLCSTSLGIVRPGCVSPSAFLQHLSTSLAVQAVCLAIYASLPLFYRLRVLLSFSSRGDLIVGILNAPPDGLRSHLPQPSDFLYQAPTGPAGFFLPGTIRRRIKGFWPSLGQSKPSRAHA